MIYGLALWWDKFGTRVLFSDSSLSHTFPIEQFWGRAARASWVRKNLDARFNFRQNPTPPIHFAGPSLLDRACFDPASAQFVEMVKFTVMRALVSTGCPFWR